MNEKFEHIFSLRNVAAGSVVLAAILLIVSLLIPWNRPSVPSPEPSYTTTPAPSATPTPTPTETVFVFETCEQVWETLGRPLTSADPGYVTGNLTLDADSDGIACEDNPLTEANEAEIDWRAIWDKTKGNAEKFAEWSAPKLNSFWKYYAAPGLSDLNDDFKDIWENLKESGSSPTN